MKLSAFRMDRMQEAASPTASPASCYRRDRTVPDVFAERVAVAPDSIAIISSGAETSYRALDERSNALAHWLVARGLVAEALVAVALPRSDEAIVVMLATLKAGCAYLPLADGLPPARVRQIIRDSGASLLVGGKDRLEALRAWRGTDATPTILVVDDDLVSPTAGEYDRRAVDPAFGQIAVDRSRPGGLAYVMYTSGTSGIPKGVMIEHHAILRLVVDPDYVRLGPADRIMQTGALSFDASTFEIWGALLNGGAVCVPRPEELLDPDALGGLIDRHGVTTMWLTSGLFNTLVSCRPEIFARLRTLICGGERLSPHHVNRIRLRFPALALKNGYGPTENTTFTTFFEITVPVTGDVPIGRPIARTSVYLLDCALNEVPPGEVGELYAGGDGLARGYLNDPLMTAERFVANPFVPGERLYRTGDLARRRADGVIEFLGRADDQIKLHGFRIEVAEIERCLAIVPGVQDVVVSVYGVEAEDRMLVAYYTAASAIPTDTLRRRAAADLPDHMVPARFVHLARIPLTVHGKVDRQALPRPEDTVAGPPQADPANDAATETEQTLVVLWQEVLQRADVALDDRFFDVGGHSLNAVKLTHLIETRLGVVVPFTLLYETPTIRTMAARLVQTASAGTSAIDLPLVVLSSGPSASRVLYAFPPGTADALSYAALAQRLVGWSLRAFNFTPTSSDPVGFADLILKDDPDGPLCLFGYSGGGNLAFRTACELERRGRKVSAVILLDASRFLDHFVFPVGEARRLAHAFIKAEAVRVHLTNAPLRDRIVRRIEDYYESLSRILDTGVSGAALHLIVSEEATDDFRTDDGRLVSSQRAWAEATSYRFTLHHGCGPHERMLLTPYLERNASIIQPVLDSIGARADE